MGFFANLRNSAAKSRLIADAGARIEAGDLTATEDIFAHISSNPAFSQVVADFSVTQQDVDAIITGIMMSGNGARYGNHFVPVSAVLFPDTLAYLMRAERGQVSRAEAYFQVNDYFRRGAVVFEPERGQAYEVDGDKIFETNAYGRRLGQAFEVEGEKVFATDAYGRKRQQAFEVKERKSKEDASKTRESPTICCALARHGHAQFRCLS